MKNKKRYVSLIVAAFIICQVNLSYADDTSWQKFYTVGKYYNSNPSKPDQTFIFYYQINGTVNVNITNNDGFTTLIDIKNSSNHNVFKLKIPRNYPYDQSDGFPLVLNNGYREDAKKSDCFYEFSMPINNDTVTIEFVSSRISSSAVSIESIPSYCLKETIYSETTIPEFPYTIPLLAISMISIVIFYRVKSRILPLDRIRKLRSR